MTEEINAEHGESKASKRKSTKRSDPWFKRYPDDFFKGTRTLSIEARGAYNDILDLMYMNGGPIPDDDFQIACALRIKKRKWLTIRKELFDAAKLVLTPAGISNLRAEMEIKSRENSRENYAKRGSSPRLGEMANGGKPNDTNGGDAQNDTIDGLYARAEPEARSQKTDPDPQEDPTPASLESVAEDGGLAGLNGSADPMLKDVLAWMHCGTPQSARQWLATQVQVYGQNVTRDSYAKLKTELAEGGLIAKPLQTWASIAKRMRDSPGSKSTEQLPAWRREQQRRLSELRAANGSTA